MPERRGLLKRLFSRDVAEPTPEQVQSWLTEDQPGRNRSATLADEAEADDRTADPAAPGGTAAT